MSFGKTVERPFKWSLVILVRGYRRLVSPVLPPMCRFHPSCSQYALDALEARRLLPALGLILWRLMRCNPLCRGGYDPVVSAPPGPEPSTHPR